jgi:hypothetical protein
MYNRSLADPDGHIWEAMWMDPAAAGNHRPRNRLTARRRIRTVRAIDL